jgi:nucleotide-binding universal stress UspA family protein
MQRTFSKRNDAGVAATGGHMLTNKRILIAVDKSPASREAVAFVADMVACNPEVHVGLLHLEVPPRMAEWGGSEDPKIEDKVSEERAREYQSMQQEAIEKGRALLQPLQGILAEKRINDVCQLVEFEEPLTPKTIASHLIKTAEEKNYDTVVVGRKSWSGLKALFANHVGEELLRLGEGVTICVVK